MTSPPLRRPRRMSIPATVTILSRGSPGVSSSSSELGRTWTNVVVTAAPAYGELPGSGGRLIGVRAPLRFAGAVLATAILTTGGLVLAGWAADPPAPARDPPGSVSSPVQAVDPRYWTPERMAEAKPMPMPTPR